MDEKAEIILFERERYISYANSGLPYYIGGVISERKGPCVQTPENFFTRLTFVGFHLCGAKNHGPTNSIDSIATKSGSYPADLQF